MMILGIDCPEGSSRYALQSIDNESPVAHIVVKLHCTRCNHRAGASYDRAIKNVSEIHAVSNTVRRAISQYLGGISDDDEHQIQQLERQFKMGTR